MNRWLFLLLAFPLLACSPWAEGADAHVTIEAESAGTVDAPVVVVTTDTVPEGSKLVPDASGDAYLAIPQGQGNPPENPAGKAALMIDVPADGTYTLWCRVWWMNECGNSFTVQINDAPPFLFGEDATYKTWHWVRYPVARTAKPIALKAGQNTLTFLNREDGVCLDQVVLSTNRRFVPVDQEPVGVKSK